MFGGRNFTTRRMQEAASMEAPTPWTALNASSIHMLWESPHASEAMLNTRNPPMRTLLIAPQSDSFPNMRIRPDIVRK